jgi:hypothetical protein
MAASRNLFVACRSVLRHGHASGHSAGALLQFRGALPARVQAKDLKAARQAFSVA